MLLDAVQRWETYPLLLQVVGGCEGVMCSHARSCFAIRLVLSCVHVPDSALQAGWARGVPDSALQAGGRVGGLTLLCRWAGGGVPDSALQAG